MAIWDENAYLVEDEQANQGKKNESGITGSKKCPGCASALIFDPNLGKLICGNCGSLYNPGTMKFDGSLDIGVIKKVSEENADKVEFSCQNCGAIIVTKKETAATFCAYCGSPTIIKRKLTYEFTPNYIIPFSITKEEAVSRFKEWLNSQKTKPINFGRGFQVQNHISGVYVPFWLIDADVEGQYFARGITNGISGKRLTNINRKCNFGLRRVPFDGLKSIDNILMRSLEPFDYNKLEYYNDDYLPGFYALRYSETPLQMTDIIKSRMDLYGKEACKYFNESALNSFNCIENEKINGLSSGYSSTYALLPVWFITYNYKGVNHTFCVNGESGKVGGSVPHSKMTMIRKNIFVYAKMSIWYVAEIFAVVLLIKNLFSVTGFADLLLWSMWLAVLAFFAWILFEITTRMLNNVQFDSYTAQNEVPQIENYLDLSIPSNIEINDVECGLINEYGNMENENY